MKPNTYTVGTKLAAFGGQATIVAIECSAAGRVLETIICLENDQTGCGFKVELRRLARLVTVGIVEIIEDSPEERIKRMEKLIKPEGISFSEAADAVAAATDAVEEVAEALLDRKAAKITDYQTQITQKALAKALLQAMEVDDQSAAIEKVIKDFNIEEIARS